MNAADLLGSLKFMSPDHGEALISEWLDTRAARDAVAELLAAAAAGTPGERGAAFALLDRMGAVAAAVRAALTVPQSRPHAALWLLEHGEDVKMAPGDREWLLVDLGAGLLDGDADPTEVAAELLPCRAPDVQAAIVADMAAVRHPALIDVLTALGDHHPEPVVRAAAREALTCGA